MVSAMNPWTLLGLNDDADERTVKRQYAKLLKVTRPDEDPEAFQRLREAYERALDWSRNRADEDDEFDSRAVIAWSENISRDDYLRRWGTISSVLVADRRSKTEMLAAIETVLDDAPETSGRAELVLPQLTEVYRYRRTA